MAARRLLIVMVVLLGLSTLAAALVPPPDPKPDRPPAQATREPGARGEEESGGGSEPRLVTARMRIANEPPKVVAVRPGDQLELEVSGSVGEDIEVPAFGLTETMTPDAPARFDLIVDRPGSFVVRAVESGIVAGRIRSAEAKTACASSPAPGGEGSGSSCAPRGGREPRAAGRSGRQPSAAGDRQRP